VITATLLGAAAGGDRTAFGQTFLAHPLVSASVAGWLVGAPAEGVWLGIALTAWSTPRLPVGETSVRDWTSAAVAGPFMVGPAGEEAAWGASILLGVAVAVLGGRVIGLVRNLAVRGDRAVEASARDGNLARLERVHLTLAALHFARGGLVVLGASLLGRWVLAEKVALLGPPETVVLGWTWRLAPVAGLPILLRFHRGPKTRWLVAGVTLGLLAGWGWGRPA
jgi:mannose/fructose/N-acetylgalactosamine-specific phosphotransferase system component IIC